MRLHFSLSANNKTIPFDYQHNLISTFHRWMGWNTIHDEISLYSLSWLKGRHKIKDGFNFPDGASWFISFWNEDIGRQLIINAMKDSEIGFGMKVKEIQIQETPEFSSKERFIVSSPILIRKYDQNGNAKHLTYKDEDTEKYLTETLKRKLAFTNLNYDVKVYFDKNYPKPKTKLVKINSIENRANFCPVIIEGHSEAIKFAWNVGIGHSTGCGFGALQ